jgi:phytoene dehydrogenase-like protein
VPLANPYDYIEIADFSFGIAHPKERCQAELQARFPGEKEAIERWLETTDRAMGAAQALLAARGLPGWLAAAVRF